MLHWDLKETVCCQFMPDYYASYLLVCHDNSYSFCDQCQYPKQLCTYPSPNSTLTLTCYQLTVKALGEG